MDAMIIDRLPPPHLPDPATAIAPSPQPTRIDLRPLDMADGAAAYVLAEDALLGIAAGNGPSGVGAEDQRVRQMHWEGNQRLWSGWIQTMSRGAAWGAVDMSDLARASAAVAPLVGYARAVRDAAARVEYLTELFVHPALQGGKIGQALLGAVLAPVVPDSWRRLIIAHPLPAPLALYHRWGTYPLATVWYLMLRPDRAHQLTGRTEQRNGRIRPLESTRDLPALHWLDQTVLGRTRDAQHLFMLRVIGAHGLVLERNGTLAGYGLRTGEQIGPVVGETANDTLAITRALLRAALAEGAALPGCWVPGANIAVLQWLRGVPGRLILGSQVTLMSSSPDLATGLDRAVLTSPPYLG